MNEIRLQKYMAYCGIASRRKCEEFIKNGRVKVNGRHVVEMGFLINPNNDKIEFDGQLIMPEDKKIYILLNKPTGYVTTVFDPQKRPIVMDLIKDIDQRVYPVGRLDFNSSGLLIMTNDGELANQLTHPRHHFKKVYNVRVRGKINAKELLTLKNGVDIGGYITAPADVKIISQSSKYTDIVMGISEGKNRQIRRMLAAVNHPVILLNRIAIGSINIKNLEVGKWRYLSKDELKSLQ